VSNVLIWVQHLLGTGHLSRALTLASALTSRGLDVTVASGGPPAPWLDPDRARLVQLPPIAASGIDFAALLDATAREVDEPLWQRRREALLGLFRDTAPRVLVTEMFPFGRRAFRRELLPLLEAAQASGTARVASVRDILVAKGEPERYRWMLDLAIDHFETILVHGDPAVVPFAASFPFTADLGDRLVETGFIVPPIRLPASAIGLGEVLVSAGGGRVGRRLLETALMARSLLPADSPTWRLIASESLATGAGPGIIVDRQRPDFRDLLGNSLLSVSQAGYNTVVEALVIGKRMVLVPFETAGENEQWTRAARLEELGLARTVRESDLSPARLATAVAAALADPLPRGAVDLDGAARSSAIIAALAVARGAVR
jgi:predicted glycosyltransferase